MSKNLCSAFIVLFSIVFSAKAVEPIQAKCETSEVVHLKMLVDFNPSSESVGWNSNPAGIYATSYLKKLSPILSNRLIAVFDCNGIDARFPSANEEDKALAPYDYILSIKPASAYQDSRVGTTVTVNLDLLAPSPRKVIWNTKFTFLPNPAFSFFKSTDEKMNAQVYRLSTFILRSLYRNKIYEPPNPLVDFYGEKIEMKAKKGDQQ